MYNNTIIEVVEKSVIDAIKNVESVNNIIYYKYIHQK